MKYIVAFLVLSISLAFASSWTTELLKSVAGQAKKQYKLDLKRNDKKSLSSCNDQAPDYSTALSFGTSYTFNISASATSTCKGLYFDVTSSWNQDVIITATADNYIDFQAGYIVNYINTGPGFSSQESWSIFSFNGGTVTERLSSCDLSEEVGRWYIVFGPTFTGDSVNVQISATVASPTAPIVRTEGTISVIVPESNPLVTVNINLLDPTKSHWLYVDSLTANGTTPNILAGGSGNCPGDSNIQYENGQRVRNTVANTPIPLGVSTYGGDTYQVDFFTRTELVVCQAANPALEFCSEVTWPIADWQYAKEDEGLLAFALAFLSGSAGADCTAVFKQLICGTTFAECDENGFNKPPCQADCEALVKYCPTLFSSGSTPSCPDIEIAGSKCYVDFSDASRASVSFFSVVLLLALIFFH